MSEYQKNNPASIQNMFDSIASNYDRANTVLSFGLHKFWNYMLARSVINNSLEHSYLDLCTGTGDIAFVYLKNTTPKQAILVDFSEKMLGGAKSKLTHYKNIEYIQADVMSLPLAANSIDSATMAYGIRNVKDPIKCFQEIHRVLKPGGQIGILELTQPSNAILRIGHKLYLKIFLPILGKLVTSNKSAYYYLQSSIQSFIPPQDLEKKMLECQFSNVTRKSLSGGIATILIGTK